VECHRGPFVRVVSGQEDGAAIDGEAAAVAGSLDLPVSDLVDPRSSWVRLEAMDCCRIRRLTFTT
jgi:hypothetical protein